MNIFTAELLMQKEQLKKLEIECAYNMACLSQFQINLSLKSLFSNIDSISLAKIIFEINFVLMTINFVFDKYANLF